MLSKIIPGKGGYTLYIDKKDLIDLVPDAEPEEIFKALYEPYIQGDIKNVPIVNFKKIISKIFLNNNIEFNIYSSFIFTNIG
ncbi:MAG: hypothetical protein ACFFAN_13435 [Promethearchaeota archaeon]